MGVVKEGRKLYRALVRSYIDGHHPVYRINYSLVNPLIRQTQVTVISDVYTFSIIFLTNKKKLTNDQHTVLRIAL